MQKVPYTQIGETTVWGTIFQQTFGFTNLEVVGNLRGELRETDVPYTQLGETTLW